MTQWDTSKGDLSYSKYFHPDMFECEKDLGVSISGGGARCCSIVVGLLRGLHERGILSKVKLLSLVSGGAFGVSGFVSYLFANRAKELGIDIRSVEPFTPSDEEISQAIDDLDQHLDKRLANFFFFGRRVIFSTIVGLLTSVIVWLSIAWIGSQSVNFFAGPCLRASIQASAQANGGHMSWFRPHGYAFGCVIGTIAEGALTVMRWPLGPLVNLIAEAMGRVHARMPYDLGVSSTAFILLVIVGATDQILWEFVHSFRTRHSHPFAVLRRLTKAVFMVIMVLCILVLVWDTLFESIYFTEFLIRPILGNKISTLSLIFSFFSDNKSIIYSRQHQITMAVIGVALIWTVSRISKNMASFLLDKFAILIWMFGFLLLGWFSVFELEDISPHVNVLVLVVSVSVLGWYGLNAKNKHSYYQHLVRDVYLSKNGGSLVLNDLAKLQRPVIAINATVHNVCLKGDDRKHIFVPQYPEGGPSTPETPYPPVRRRPVSLSTTHPHEPSNMLMPAAGYVKQRNGHPSLLTQDMDEAEPHDCHGSCLWPCYEGWEMGPRSVFIMSGSVTGAPGLGFRKTPEYLGYWPLSEAVAVSASFWTGVVEITGPLRSVGGRFSLFLYNWSLGRWAVSPRLLPSSKESLFVLLRVPFLKKFLTSDKSKAWLRILAWHKTLYRSILLAMPALVMLVSLALSSLPISVAAVIAIALQHFGGLWSPFLKRVMHFQSWFANHYMVLGVNTSDCPFHYLSDGGHLDNLGLTTMLLARTKTILLFDNGRDEDRVMDDLYRAMEVGERRCGVTFRIDHSVATVDDLRLSIDELKKIEIERSMHGEEYMGTVSATKGRILKIIATYPPQNADEMTTPRTSTIWYVKATTLTEHTPVKLWLYALSNRRFPNDPTIDVYDSQRYRAYRDLGHHCAHELADIID